MGAGRTEAAVPGHAEDSEAQRDGDDEVAEPAETGDVFYSAVGDEDMTDEQKKLFKK
jgi:hypothetical protein